MIMDRPVLAVTPGEPAGIGPECLLRLHAQQTGLRLLAVADSGLLTATADQLGLATRIETWQPGDPVGGDALSCREVRLAAASRPGQLDPANAEYVLDTLRQAAHLVQSGQAGALVTGPVHKGVINDAGIAFSGHTEFLAKLAGVERVVMMLAADDLRVALVTTHLPLRDVPAAITSASVERTIRITHAELVGRFGLPEPVLQVLGLNPHAGEGGHLGHEDDDIIAPAIAACRAAGINAVGPVPADSAFTRPALQASDAVIAMYHDQGLPVLKHAGFGRSVNVTLGLPFIRTSVDHGTALDIAGRGEADAGSLLQAAQLAQRLCRDEQP